MITVKNLQKSNKTIINTVFYTFLLMIILGGIVFRVFALKYSLDIYYDEMALLNNILDRSFLEYFSPLSYEQCAPPIFMLLGKFLYSLFGYNQIKLKLIAFIPSVFSLFAYLYLCFLLFKNRLTIILSAFFFAFQYNLINYAAIFKPYSTDVLFTILILIFTLRYNKIKEKFNYKHYIFLGLVAGCCILFSYTSMFVIISSFCIILLKNILKDKKINIKNTICFLIPFLTVFLFMLFSVFIPTTKINGLITFWSNSSFFFPVTTRNWNLLLSYITINIPFYWIVFFVSLILMFKKNKFLCGIIFLPIVGAMLAGYLKIYPMSGRVILYLLPLFSIIFAYPLEEIDFAEKKKLYLNILIIVSYFSFANLYEYITHYKINRNSKTMTTGKDYYEALKQLDVQENDKIFLLAEQAFVFEHLYNKFDIINGKNYNMINLFFQNPQYVPLNKNDRIIVYLYSGNVDVFQRERDVQANNYLWKTVENRCEILSSTDAEYGKIVRCKIL